MNLDKIRINSISAIIWGEPSDKMIIAAHGSHSSKIDDCIWVLMVKALRLTTKVNGVIELVITDCLRILRMIKS